jgi:aspartokinase-like uncharacterized kinase
MNVEVVLKIGGGLLAQREVFERVVQAINARPRVSRLLIVPGGGPFADTVRDVDRRLNLTDDAAHWMAILAMDQYAHLLGSRLNFSNIVDSREGIEDALAGDRLPILAPFRWLRAQDPLPHSWSVTSDSIAAWVTRAIGAPHLVLIKPAGATDDVVDGFFWQSLPENAVVTILPADQIARLDATLRGVIAAT